MDKKLVLISLMTLLLVGILVAGAEKNYEKRVIIKFKDDHTMIRKTSQKLTANETISQSINDLQIKKIVKRLDKLNMVVATVTDQELSELKKAEEVEFIEPDFKVRTQNTFWNRDILKVELLGEKGLAGKGVTIAILDTGVDYTHPSLEANYEGGYDFVNGDSEPMDDNGHGTNIAGIISGNNDNFRGIAPESKLLVYKVLDKFGEGYLSDLIAAMQQALIEKPKIIVMSFGSEQSSKILAELLHEAYNEGILIFAASGNRGGLSHTLFPASDENVIAVGAITEKLERASFSSGGHELELMAPGTNIYSASLNHGYSIMDGTSAAAPHAAALAAIVFGQFPELTNVEVRNLLIKFAQDLGPVGRDNEYGYGLITVDMLEPLLIQKEKIGDFILVRSSKKENNLEKLQLKSFDRKEYESGSSRTVVNEIEFIDQETLYKILPHYIPNGEEITTKTYQSEVFLVRNNKTAWISNNNFIVMIGLDGPDENNDLFNHYLEQYPNTGDMSRLVLNETNESEFVALARTCSDFPNTYGACYSEGLRSKQHDYVYECIDQVFGFWEDVLCWQIISSLGNDDYCAVYSCSYGEWDCDFDLECSSLDCVDYDGDTCFFGLECGCCSWNERWDELGNYCYVCKTNQDCVDEASYGVGYKCQSNNCVMKSCSDYPATDGPCSSLGTKEKHGSAVYECKQKELIKCWEQISYNGYDNYCADLSFLGYKCGYDEYDCDYNSECYTNHCVGTRLGGICWGYECGCCNSNEVWDTATNHCKALSCSDCGGVWYDDNLCDKEECLGIGDCYACVLGDNCRTHKNWGPAITNCNEPVPFGDADYCIYKNQKYNGCTHVEYDCDADYECLSGLVCDGSSTGLNTVTEGCCYPVENWNDAKKYCNDAIKGEVYAVQTTSSGNFNSNLLANANLRFWIYDKDPDFFNNQDDFIDTKMVSAADGSFAYNPERNFSDWNQDNTLWPLAKDYFIKKVEIIQNNEVIGTLTNSFSKEDVYRLAKKRVWQNIRVHTDMVYWRKPSETSAQSLKEFRIQNPPSLPSILVSQSLNDSNITRRDVLSGYWKGKLAIVKEGNYSILINLTGGLKMRIDGIELINDWNYYPNGKIRIIPVNLLEGDHNLSIEYFYETGTQPIMMWKYEKEEFSIIPKEALKKELHDSGTFNYENQGYKYQKQSFLSQSVTNTNEDFQVSFVEYPQNPTYTAKPLVLVHGMHGKSGYWENIGGGIDFEEELTKKGHEVWKFYYPNDQSNNYSAALLKDGLNFVLSHYASYNKADVVAHSMGTLVTKGYTLGLGVTNGGIKVPYGNNINRTVYLGGPMHGSYLANRVLQNPDELLGLGCDFLSWVIGIYKDSKPDNSEPAYHDLAVGSEFTWNLAVGGVNKDIQQLALSGTENFLCVPFEADQSDGLVSLASASLLSNDVPYVVIGKNHANEKGQTLFLVDGGDNNHSDIINIVHKFLIGQSKSSIIQELGPGEFYVDPLDPTSNPYTEGAALVRFVDTSNIKGVALSNDMYWFNMTKDDLIVGTDVWYHFNEGEIEFINCLQNRLQDVDLSQQNLGICMWGIKLALATENPAPLIPCLTSLFGPAVTNLIQDNFDFCKNLKPIDYGLTFPAGTYDVFTKDFSNNWHDFGLDIIVKPASTATLLVNNTSSCYDGIKNGDETGIDCGSSCVTQDPEICNNLDDNHNCQIDESAYRNCSDNYLGDCAMGIEICIAGNWQGCPLPKIETCNGRDEDCDGILDGSEVLSRQCGISNIGICTFGMEVCNDGGQWINCNAQLPIFEVGQLCSNTLDDDCDRLVDINDDNCTDIPLIYNPKEGEKLDNRKILLNVSVNKIVKYIKYQIDGKVTRNGELVFRTLCRNCDHVEKSVIVLDGNHTIGVVTINEDNRQFSDDVGFFVDSKKPRIIKQEPRNKKYCNGNFKVRYTEEYPKNIYLYYGNDVLIKDDCPSGRNQECEFDVPLAQYENKSIKFHFEVEDTLWKIPYRMNYTCLVDTIPPNITNLKWRVEGRYLYLNISLDEKAKSLKYIDYYDSRKTGRNLCSNCNEYGALRVKKMSVRKGSHNLTIIAEGKAGNQEKRDINFIISY